MMHSKHHTLFAQHSHQTSNNAFGNTYIYFANPTQPYSVALHLSQTNLRLHATCTTNHPAKMKVQHIMSSSSSSSSPLQSASDPNNYKETAEEDDDVNAVEQRRQMLISILAKAMEISPPPPLSSSSSSSSSLSSSNATFAPATSSRLGGGDQTHPQQPSLPPAAAVVENRRRRRGDVADFRSFPAAAASRHSQPQRLQEVQRSQLERQGVSAIVGIRLSNDDEGDGRNDEGGDDEHEHNGQE